MSTVDKFGRADSKVTASYEPVIVPSTLDVTELNEIFVKRDGTNSVTGTLNMSGNTLRNVSEPVHDHDVANKVYVDENSISKNGGEMQGDLNMNNHRLRGLASTLPHDDDDAISWAKAVELVRSAETDCTSRVSKSGDIVYGNLLISAEGGNNRGIGCTDLDFENSFSVMLGNVNNKLYFIYRRAPVVLSTEHGFLVQAGDQDVCRLGDEAGEIIIHKDMRMNGNRITNLQAPIFPHEVANKLYVDRTPRKIFQGYIPSLRSLGNLQNNKFGFIATASSSLNQHFNPTNAFNMFYVNLRGMGGEWATNQTRNFWLQIQCPDSVRVWKVGLRGRDNNRQRIYKWNITGSNDGESFTVLFRAPNPTYLGNEVQFFPFETPHKYRYFRLDCEEAEPREPGISYFQLFIYSD